MNYFLIFGSRFSRKSSGLMNPFWVFGSQVFEKKQWSHEFLLGISMSDTKQPVTQRHISDERLPHDFSSCTWPVLTFPLPDITVLDCDLCHTALALTPTDATFSEVQLNPDPLRLCGTTGSRLTIILPPSAQTVPATIRLRRNVPPDYLACNYAMCSRNYTFHCGWYFRNFHCLKRYTQ